MSGSVGAGRAVLQSSGQSGVEKGLGRKGIGAWAIAQRRNPPGTTHRAAAASAEATHRNNDAAAECQPGSALAFGALRDHW